MLRKLIRRLQREQVVNPEECPYNDCESPWSVSQGMAQGDDGPAENRTCTQCKRKWLVEYSAHAVTTLDH